MKNNSEEDKSIHVPYTNSHLLSPSSSKISTSTKNQYKSNTTINVAQYKNMEKQIQIQNNGRKLNKTLYGPNTLPIQHQYHTINNDCNDKKTDIPSVSNTFHDLKKRQIQNLNRSLFSYFFSPNNVDPRRNIVVDPIFIYHTNKNNIVQKATDDST